MYSHFGLELCFVKSLMTKMELISPIACYKWQETLPNIFSKPSISIKWWTKSLDYCALNISVLESPWIPDERRTKAGSEAAHSHSQSGFLRLASLPSWWAPVLTSTLTAQSQLSLGRSSLPTLSSVSSLDTRLPSPGHPFLAPISPCSSS